MVLDKEQFDAFRMEIATFGNIPILSSRPLRISFSVDIQLFSL